MSNSSPNPRPVREQAIEWLVTLRDDELDEATLQAFSQWLDQDSSHAQAFTAAELLFQDMVTAAKRRAKLSRVLGKRALKSFHPRLFNDRLFAGETWSDKNGCTTRNQATAFC